MRSLPSSKMGKIAKPKETQEESSIRKLQKRIQQGKNNPQDLEKLASEPEKCLLSHSPLDQLVLASKIDDTVHQLIQKLETNIKVLKRLVRIPRTKEVMKTIDTRSSLGIQILKLVNSHVQLDVTQPLVQTRWEINDGELKPISPEGLQMEKM